MQVTPAPSDAAPASAGSAAIAAAGAPETSGQPAGLLRNTAYLTIAQAATIPMSIATNAVMGRCLKAEEFGYLYLASTLCTFAVLALEWGHSGAITTLIARNRSTAGMYLGTTLATRTLIALPIGAVLTLICYLMGYTESLWWAIGLSFPLALLNSWVSAFRDTIRGFERMDIPALSQAVQQVLQLLVLVPVLILGGQMRALLLSHMAMAGVVLLFLQRSMKKVGVTRLEVRKSAVAPLYSLGTPFVFFSLAMVLLPIVNAAYLSKLVPPEVVGWYSVSQRLIGLLLFPASALIGALYPTLCRLHLEDPKEYARVARGALYSVSLLAIPATVGCGFFPELGVAIFGAEKYAGAADHLRVMAVFVFLVYFSMPLGTAIMSANRPKPWALVQCICIVVALVGNPILVPWFQARTGNGALGTCVALVLSEVLVVICGLGLLPRGVIDRSLGKSVLLAALAGVAMALVAHFTKPISLFLAVPLALLTYGGLAWFSGAVQQSTIALLKGYLARKLSRAR